MSTEKRCDACNEVIKVNGFKLSFEPEGLSFWSPLYEYVDLCSKCKKKVWDFTASLSKKKIDTKS